MKKFNVGAKAPINPFIKNIAGIVPKYTDVISVPMYLELVEKNTADLKYSSLESFFNDLRLIVSNAKKFNPPGDVYHVAAVEFGGYIEDECRKAEVILKAQPASAKKK